ncbi:aromatic ring-hydroxylating dioxygenase subunit alpha [Croceicoccus sp. BE223]|uniref:aromatic ring-hydroxylating oxygenase subunit alpha n=1 Tax=Croceicoccus sp. BE223 TaxID=2817716 RepID=UPI0028572386|nr:aromatic ring-hydroxylating dioxygenase subunit alpha [Croceicoccus sp. BE223]MDR7102384.1 phenylpropionate dioxygenase-like ring-hydroxylating dioxygenase large terminal subunit [Croceicoccus sp. BE223]
MNADTNPVPDFLIENASTDLGSEPIEAERYTSPLFFAREVEKMWPAVWQFAAREEEMPEPGDHVVYENVGRSFLLVRQEDGTIRAFHNVCLHRGRVLKDESGWSAELQCPFHGFTWNNDGSLKSIPCSWDFSHLHRDEMRLPEISVGRWGGYIFIREADEGPSLEEYLAPLPAHFEGWNHAECYTALWVAKVVPANWKVTAEAFMEAWHSLVTHPQLLPFTGDANSAYNVWGDHVNANLVPFAVLSPHLDPEGRTQQWIVDEFVKYSGRSADNYDPDKDDFNVQVPDGMSARQAMGESLRAAAGAQSGRDLSAAADAELCDALVYNVFPNFSPWGGYMPNIVYRWRPWPDQDRTLMEVRILMRSHRDDPMPRSVPMTIIPDDQPWASEAALGALGGVFDQDMENLPQIQKGLKASKTGKVQLANYQEIRIRHFHQTLDKYLAR